MPKHLCNQVLLKKLRFSLQRHKSCKKLRFLRYSAKPNSGTVCRLMAWNVFPPMEPAICIRIQRKLNSGLWLGAFGKVWLFRCQSTPGSPVPCYSYLQPGFAKKTAFFSAKAQSCKKLRFLRYSAKQNSWIVCRFPLLRLETPVLATAMSKSSRIRRSRILGLYAGSRL